MNSPLIPRSAYQEGLEARFARRLLARVEGDHASVSVPHDIAERLRFARQRSVEVAQQSRRQPVASALAVGRGASALSLGAVPWWLRIASALPLLLLVVGLVGIGHLNNLERIRAAADVDAVLLADDLPLAAYSDPGFAEFLKTQAP